MEFMESLDGRMIMHTSLVLGQTMTICSVILCTFQKKIVSDVLLGPEREREYLTTGHQMIMSPELFS